MLNYQSFFVVKYGSYHLKTKETRSTLITHPSASHRGGADADFPGGHGHGGLAAAGAEAAVVELNRLSHESTANKNK
jgi:hypothetical protein